MTHLQTRRLVFLSHSSTGPISIHDCSGYSRVRGDAHADRHVLLLYKSTMPTMHVTRSRGVGAPEAATCYGGIKTDNIGGKKHIGIHI